MQELLPEISGDEENVLDDLFQKYKQQKESVNLQIGSNKPERAKKCVLITGKIAFYLLEI